MERRTKTCGSRVFSFRPIPILGVCDVHWSWKLPQFEAKKEATDLELEASESFARRRLAFLLGST